MYAALTVSSEVQVCRLLTVAFAACSGYRKILARVRSVEFLDAQETLESMIVYFVQICGMCITLCLPVFFSEAVVDHHEYFLSLGIAGPLSLLFLRGRDVEFINLTSDSFGLDLVDVVALSLIFLFSIFSKELIHLAPLFILSALKRLLFAANCRRGSLVHMQILESMLIPLVSFFYVVIVDSYAFIASAGFILLMVSFGSIPYKLSTMPENFFSVALLYPANQFIRQAVINLPAVIASYFTPSDLPVMRFSQSVFVGISTLVGPCINQFRVSILNREVIGMKGALNIWYSCVRSRGLVAIGSYVVVLIMLLLNLAPLGFGSSLTSVFFVSLCLVANLAIPPFGVYFNMRKLPSLSISTTVIAVIAASPLFLLSAALVDFLFIFQFIYLLVGFLVFWRAVLFSRG